MNTIPTIGPDAGISPRSGSANPQTPAQQRADAAPSVLSDATAKADPGVMLKITPPVVQRDSSTNIGQQVPDDQIAAFLAKQRLDQQQTVIQLGGKSAEEADQAIVKRLADVFASLPPDIQDAIKNASSPAIAQLMKLAAMTSRGIRDAPAVFQQSNQALGQDPVLASQELLRSIGEADAFRLANALRALHQHLSVTRQPFDGAEAQMMEGANGVITQVDELTTRAESGTRRDLGVAPRSQAATLRAAYGQSGTLETNIMSLLMSGSGSTEAMVTSSEIMQVNRASAGSETAAAGQATPGGQGQTNPGGQTVANATLGASLNAETTAVVSPRETQNPFGLNANQLEQGVKDGLKLLMDGRMVWQGQFTEGVPVRLERSDAWQTNRRAIGGMEKGSSIRLQIQLPSLGLLEVRALGFGGQVSARVHAASSSASALAQSLPDLLERLRHRGLSGAQVVVEDL